MPATERMPNVPMIISPLETHRPTKLTQRFVTLLANASSNPSGQQFSNEIGGVDHRHRNGIGHDQFERAALLTLRSIRGVQGHQKHH